METLMETLDNIKRGGHNLPRFFMQLHIFRNGLSDYKSFA